MKTDFGEYGEVNKAWTADGREGLHEDSGQPDEDLLLTCRHVTARRRNEGRRHRRRRLHGRRTAAAAGESSGGRDRIRATATATRATPSATCTAGCWARPTCVSRRNTNLGAIDVLFLCSAHGRSREFLAANALPDGLRIVDLAQDFRDESEGFVYGLPELKPRPHPCGAARGQSRLLRHGDPAGAAAAGP